MLLLLWWLGAVATTTYCSAVEGRENPDKAYVLFGNAFFVSLFCGAVWPITLATYFPYLYGQRLGRRDREVTAFEAENMAEVEAFLKPARQAEARVVALPTATPWLDPTHPDNVGHPTTCKWFDCGICRHEAYERTDARHAKALPAAGHSEICTCKRCKSSYVKIVRGGPNGGSLVCLNCSHSEVSYG